MLWLCRLRRALWERRAAWLSALLLSGLMVATPAIVRSLADSPWTRGLYDGGDYDDPAAGGPPADLPLSSAPVQSIAVVSLVARRAPAPETRRLIPGFPRRSSPRAPPLS